MNVMRVMVGTTGRKEGNERRALGRKMRRGRLGRKEKKRKKRKGRREEEGPGTGR